MNAPTKEQFDAAHAAVQDVLECLSHLSWVFYRDEFGDEPAVKKHETKLRCLAVGLEALCQRLEAGHGKLSVVLPHLLLIRRNCDVQFQLGTFIKAVAHEAVWFYADQQAQRANHLIQCNPYSSLKTRAHLSQWKPSQGRYPLTKEDVLPVIHRMLEEFWHDPPTSREIGQFNERIRQEHAFALHDYCQAPAAPAAPGPGPGPGPADISTTVEAPTPLENGPHDGSLWWNGSIYRVPRGQTYQLLDFMWSRESARYDTLNREVFDNPQTPDGFRAYAKRVNKILRRAGVPWILEADKRDRLLSKSHQKTAN